jgi:uncharacterized membrane protein YfcA
MAFGVISNTLLISMGVPPRRRRRIVHTIKNFTGSVSAVSHIYYRNVDWKLFGGCCARPDRRRAWRLCAGGAPRAGAKPLVLGYLAAIGIFLIWRGITRTHKERDPRVVEPLGVRGRFLDAAGGGGWGPIVTSNLIVQGGTPANGGGHREHRRSVPGVAITATFIFSIGFSALGAPRAGPADRRGRGGAVRGLCRGAGVGALDAADGRNRASRDKPLRPLKAFG